MGIAVLHANSVHSAEKEDLDVNLNPIYISTKSHRDNNVQSEVVVQIPIPLSKESEETGLGSIGAIVYFDNKDFVRKKANAFNVTTQNESATVRGLGRLYYVYSAYETTHTLIPYLTLFREHLFAYKDTSGKQVDGKSRAWLLPGFEYAYRMDDKVVLHFDAELYSYSKLGNNTSRVGASYALAEKWLVSASYERLVWDMKDGYNKSVAVNGSSDNIYLKLINSNPLRNNFSFILGYAADRNTTGLQPIGIKRSNGLFWGLELSLGTLAW